MAPENQIDLKDTYIESQPDDIRALLLRREYLDQRSTVWGTRCTIAMTACAVALTLMVALVLFAPALARI